MRSDGEFNEIAPPVVSEALSQDAVIRGYRELAERHEVLVRQQQALIERLVQLLALLPAPRVTPGGATFYPAAGPGFPARGKS